MTAAADFATIREALERVLRVDDHGFVYAGSDADALAALARVEAENARLREALDWADGYLAELDDEGARVVRRKIRAALSGEQP